MNRKPLFLLLGLSMTLATACGDNSGDDTTDTSNNSDTGGDGDGDGDGDVCGDGMMTGDEACDDGNDDNTDACTTECEIAACGDGFVYEGEEACDDGNDDNTDNCLDTCEVAACGDGFVYEGEEACDDGNDDNTDDCLDTCVAASCGDGFIWANNEDCDDENDDNNDACIDTCVAASCGDGFVWDDNEACDDGNDVNNDECSNMCTLPLYQAEGPQTNVPEEDLIGWEECFSGTYNQSGTNLNNLWQNTCDGDNLMFACRQVGSDTFSVLAHAPRADVLTDTGNGNNPHNANGVGWYYSDSYSLGFAREGDALSRNSCDTANTNPQDRLCWHSGSGNINGGWRCGAQTGLNNNAQWERVILHAD